jgi:hypothetical protein
VIDDDRKRGLITFGCAWNGRPGANAVAVSADEVVGVIGPTYGPPAAEIPDACGSDDGLLRREVDGFRFQRDESAATDTCSTVTVAGCDRRRAPAR